MRVSVRKQPQIATLSLHPLLLPYLHRLDFVVVPDITVPGAFDDVLQDVVYIQHVASPLPRPTDDPDTDIIRPAINGTLSILESAQKAEGVRRVVITSSLVAVIPDAALTNGDAVTIYTAQSRVSPLPTAPWGDLSSVYRAAKVLALDATDRFVAEKKPRFSVVNVMPGYVLGPHELVTENAEELISGSNAIPLSIVKGAIARAARPGSVVHVHDVSRILAGSLDEKRVVVADETSRSFLLDTGHVQFDDVNAIVQKAFPNSGLPLGGSIPVVHQRADIGDVVTVFGKLRGFEDMVTGIVGQYLELKGGELL